MISPFPHRRIVRRKFLPALVVALAALASATLAEAQQCTPASSAPWNDFISGVRLGSVDNLNQSVETRRSTNSPVGYGDFRGLGVAAVKRGEPFSVEVSFYAPNYNPNAAAPVQLVVWVDQDDDPGITDSERLITQEYLVPANVGNAGTMEQSVVLTGVLDANGTTTGVKTLRVAVSPGTAIPSACSLAKGEFEDYSVEIAEGGEDDVRPTATITGPASTAEALITYAVRFSESVTGLTEDDFQVTGAQVERLVRQGSGYALSVVATGAATVYVALPAGRVADLAGNPNEASGVTQTALEAGAAEEGYCRPSDLDPWATYMTGVEVVLDGRAIVSNVAQADPRSGNSAPFGYNAAPPTSRRLAAGERATATVDYVGTNYDPNGALDLTLTAWLDVNLDGQLAASEVVGRTVAPVPANDAAGAGLAEHTVTFDLVVPTTAVGGASLLRFTLSAEGPVGACSRGFKGEVEDYPLEVEPVDPLEQEGFPITWTYVPPTVQAVGTEGYQVSYHHARNEYLVGCNPIAATGVDGFVELVIEEDFLADSSYVYLGLIAEEVLASSTTNLTDGTDDADHLVGLRGNVAEGVYPRDVAIKTAGQPLRTYDVAVPAGTRLRIEFNGDELYFYVGSELVQTAPRPREARTYFPIVYVNHFGRDDQVLFSTKASTNCNDLRVTPQVSPAVAGRGGGTVDLEVLGGTQPYRVSWSDGYTTASLVRTGLDAGAYSYILTEAGGESRTSEVRVAELGRTVFDTTGCIRIRRDQFLNGAGGGCDPGGNAIRSAAFDVPDQERIVEVTLLQDVRSVDGLDRSFQVGLTGGGGIASMIGIWVTPFSTRLVVGSAFDAASIYDVPEVSASDSGFPSAGDVYTLKVRRGEVAVLRNGKLLYREPIPAGRWITKGEVFANVLGVDNAVRMRVRTNYPVSVAEEPLPALQLQPELSAWPFPAREHVVPVRFKHRYAGGELRPIRASLTSPREPRVNLLGSAEYVPTPGINDWIVNVPRNLEGYYLLTLYDVDYDEVRRSWIRCARSGYPDPQPAVLTPDSE